MIRAFGLSILEVPEPNMINAIIDRSGLITRFPFLGSLDFFYNKATFRSKQL